jgi:hypothetical protein
VLLLLLLLLFVAVLLLISLWLLLLLLVGHIAWLLLLLHLLLLLLHLLQLGLQPLQGLALQERPGFRILLAGTAVAAVAAALYEDVTDAQAKQSLLAFASCLQAQQ